jgi:hypothetical protein
MRGQETLMALEAGLFGLASNKLFSHGTRACTLGSSMMGAAWCQAMGLDWSATWR